MTTGRKTITQVTMGQISSALQITGSHTAGHGPQVMQSTLRNSELDIASNR